MAVNSTGGPQAPLDALARFAFAGYIVPAERWTISGGIRDHVHEYSHQDGGDPEKLGRSLYRVRVDLNMQGKFRLYPNLWPQITNALVALWEKGTTDDLTVPSIGTIQAYAVNWTREWTYKLRSGEKVTVEFREDKSNLPLPLLTTGISPNSLDTTADALKVQQAKAQGLTPADQDLFTALQSLVNSLTAISDTASLEGNLIAQRCAQVIAMCQQIDALVPMQQPTNALTMRALHDLWVQCIAYQKDVQTKNQTLQQWITPSRMSIARVSTAIYGDSTHISDLLSLNSGSFTDSMNIPAGITIVYYPVSQNASS